MKGVSCVRLPRSGAILQSHRNSYYISLLRRYTNFVLCPLQCCQRDPTLGRCTDRCDRSEFEGTWAP